MADTPPTTSEKEARGIKPQFTPPPAGALHSPSMHGYEECSTCGGFGSTLHEESDKCSECGGYGIVPLSFEYMSAAYDRLAHGNAPWVEEPGLVKVWFVGETGLEPGKISWAGFATELPLERIATHWGGHFHYGLDPASGVLCCWDRYKPTRKWVFVVHDGSENVDPDEAMRVATLIVENGDNPGLRDDALALAAELQLQLSAARPVEGDDGWSRDMRTVKYHLMRAITLLARRS